MIKDNSKDVAKDIRKREMLFLEALAAVSTNNAKAQSRVDTGLSRSSKYTEIDYNKKTIFTKAPVNYDIFLEYRYGQMAKALLQTISQIPQVARKYF